MLNQVFDILSRMVETPVPSRDEIAFLILNPETEYFKQIFTKLEATTAFEFISGVINESAIPFLVASREVLSSENVISTIGKKSASDLNKTSANISKYDEEFTKRYSNALATFGRTLYAYKGHDPFDSEKIVSALRAFNRSTVMICGSSMEVDCIASVFGALRTGFLPVIVSDACSSSSERIYYEALDVVSRVARIVDTRDLMKSWGMV